MAKAILLDFAEGVPTKLTLPTTAITPDNAKSTMGRASTRGDTRPDKAEATPGSGWLPLWRRIISGTQ